MTQAQQLSQVYSLIENTTPSECMICNRMTPTCEGVLLVNCLHSFCYACLKEELLLNERGTVQCPYPNGRYDCDGTLEDYEIECILGEEEYSNFMQRQFAAIDEAQALQYGDLEQLVAATDACLVLNPERFKCPVCFEWFEAREGVILRDCFHCFCRECLANSVIHAEDVVVTCPFQDNELKCEQEIQEREIRKLLSDDDYKKYAQRSLRKAEANIRSSFHCMTPNCDGWCDVDGEVSLFLCEVCLAENCLTCKVIHGGQSCQQYKDQLEKTQRNGEDQQSEQALNEMVSSGRAMRCSSCTTVVIKTEGCDWLVCTVCKTELCWATRGPRWGPKGHGDTSGGCGCKMNGGRLCHPQCGNCH